MTIIILALFNIFFFVFWFFYYEKKPLFSRTRLALFATFITFSLASYLFTELLSIFGLLTQWNIFLLYLLSTITLLTHLLMSKGQYKLSKIGFESFTIEKDLKFGLAVFIAFIIFPTFFLAVYFPPHIWDSLTYHLPRIEQWIQNQNISHFPTNDFRQVFYQPFSEYLMMQMRILSGSDYFNSLVQFSAYAISILAVSQIVKLYGGSRKVQFFSILFSGTIPIIMNQASTTQNDLLMGSYFILFIYYSQSYLNKKSLDDLILGSMALGFGMLTKASIYVFAFPFLLFLLYKMYSGTGKKIIKHISIFVLIIIFINGPYFARNIELSGKLFGARELSNKATMSSFSIQNTVANALRTNGMLLGSPLNISNRIIDNVVINAIGLMGIDVNSSQNTMPNHKYKSVYNTNVFHYLLVLFSVFFLLSQFVKNRQKRNKELFWLFIMTFAGFLIHSTIFRWSVISSTRYYLPLMMPLAVIVAIILLNEKKTKQSILLYIFPLIIIGSIEAFSNRQKPILNIREYAKEKLHYLPKTVMELSAVQKMNQSDSILFHNSYCLVTRFPYHFYSKKNDISDKQREMLYFRLKEYNIIKPKTSIFSESRNQNRFYNYPLFADDYNSLVNTISDNNYSKMRKDIPGPESCEYLILHGYAYFSDFLKSLSPPNGQTAPWILE